MALSRELARSKVTVITPEIPGLLRFAITPALTDRIKQAAYGLPPARRLGDRGQIVARATASRGDERSLWFRRLIQ
jgi:hypothetical protein